VTTTVTPFGDGAFLVEVEDVPGAHRLVARIEADRAAGDAPAGVGESVVGFGNVVVHLDVGNGSPAEVAPWLDALVRRVTGSGRDRGPTDGGPPVVIPVVFDGPDVVEVAARLGSTVDAVGDALCAAELQVAFLGFAPGFPYLVGLPPDLASVPRRSTPRPSVPAGSVAVAGGFASVYPQATPGGWMLLGRTTLPLFDPERPPYALLGPGDTVRFAREDRISGPSGSEAGPVVGSAASGRRPTPVHRSPLPSRGPTFAEVVDPGLLSLVQDGGRRTGAGVGVPRAGPADPEAMRLANRLVGNADDAATLEVTASGPTLRFTGGTHLAVVGATPDAVEVLLDQHLVGSGVVVPVASGQVLGIGRVRTGLRAYLAVSGGFDLPLLVGSRSSDVLSGLGPGPLRPGDRLDLGAPTRPHGLLARPTAPPATGRHRGLRVVAGPHPLEPFAYEQLLGRQWTVGAASNRIGIRLVPAPVDPIADHADPAPQGTATGGDGIPSTGMVTGAVQVPPDGHPIVLMPDHATVGGYPVACCVISADFPVLGQLAPGDTVSFTAVDLPTARRARRRWEDSLDERVSGWFPTATGT
jgi:KipI family sensor histidine kinase inhibitor